METASASEAVPLLFIGIASDFAIRRRQGYGGQEASSDKVVAR